MDDNARQHPTAPRERQATAEVTLALKVPSTTAGIPSDFTIRRLTQLAIGDVIPIRDFKCVVGSQLKGSRRGPLPADEGADVNEPSTPYPPPDVSMPLDPVDARPAAQMPPSPPLSAARSKVTPDVGLSSPVWNDAERSGDERDVWSPRPASVGDGERPNTPSPDEQRVPARPPAVLAVSEPARSDVAPRSDSGPSPAPHRGVPAPSTGALPSSAEEAPRAAIAPTQTSPTQAAPRAPESAPGNLTPAHSDLAQSTAPAAQAVVGEKSTQRKEAAGSVSQLAEVTPPGDVNARGVLPPPADTIANTATGADTVAGDAPPPVAEPDHSVLSAEPGLQGALTRNPLVDALDACAATARACDPELSVPKVFRALDAFVPSFAETLDQRPSHFTNRLGQRTELATLEEWADLFVRSWLDSMVSYLSQSEIRANPDAPAPSAVRDLLRNLQRDVLDVLSRDWDHTILILPNRAPLDRSTMEVAGIIGADRTTVAAQTAVSLQIGRRVRRRAHVLVG
jgi:hypothetical protein